MTLLAVSTSANLHTLGDGLLLSDGSAVTVDFDATLFVQIGIFIVLLLVLKPLLFEPMLKLFEERERRTEGTKREASKEDARSAKALTEYEAALAKARQAGAAERDAIRAEGLRKEAELLADIRNQTASTIEQGRAKLAAEAKAARDRLGAEAAELGRTIASRVLGREVSS